MQSTTVISLGGSLIAPDAVDHEYVKSFYHIINERLKKKPEHRFILVVGGGAPARRYQGAYNAIVDCLPEILQEAPEEERAIVRAESADFIGIAATRLNAELVRRLFRRYCRDEVVRDPEGEIGFSGRVLVAAGWKPGRSTDYVAVALAERYGADRVINLTNIAQVYSDDPRKNSAAEPLADLSWKDYRAIVGKEWTPGKNAPFDPVAAERAERAKLTVIIALGNNIENLGSILDGGPFFGTTIHP